MLVYLFNRYFADKSGATSVEYALLAGSVALAVIIGVNLMGISVDRVMTEASAGL